MSNILSDAEITEIVREHSRYLSDTCDIYRMTSSPDDYGSVTEVWSVNSSTFCRLSANFVGTTEFATNGGVDDLGLVFVSLPLTEDVTVKDRLFIKGHMYAIVGVIETTIKICLHFQCRKIG